MFNVWTDPWLTVEFSNGETKTVGIKECLVNAQSICKVFAVDGKTKQLTPLEYTNIRFLMTVIMDVFRSCFRSPSTLAELYWGGGFSEEVLDEYYKKCITEGCSFDLFDEERPFLQTDKQTMKLVCGLREKKLSFEDWLKKNVSTPANLNPLMSCGNNDVFSRKVDADKYAEFAGVDKPVSLTDDLVKNKNAKMKPEDMHSLTYAEYIQYLIFTHVSSQYCGVLNSTSLSVNSEAPPMFIIMKGKNLFETILFNAIYFKDVEKAKPLWRWSSYLDFLNEKTRNNLWEEDGVLMGMIYPSRFIYPLKHENGQVSGIFYSGMLDYIDNMLAGKNNRKIWWEETREAWAAKREPHVSYRYDQKNEKHKSYTMKSKNQSWLDLVAYINSFSTDMKATKGLKTYSSLIEELELESEQDKFVLSTYYTEMDKASYFSSGKFEYDLYRDFLTDEEKFQYFKEMIEVIKKISSDLKFCIGSYILQSKGLEVKGDAIANESFGDVITNNFYNLSKIYFFQNYIPNIEKSASSEEKRLVLIEAIEFLSRKALSLYNEITPGDAFLFAHASCAGMLYNMLKKLNPKNKEENNEQGTE